MWTKLIWIIVGVASSFGIAAVVTDELRVRIRSRGMSYFLCVVFVLVGAIICGHLAAEGPTSDDLEDYPPRLSLSERDSLIETIFYITLLPALIGVRIGLGKKPKPDRKDPSDVTDQEGTRMRTSDNEKPELSLNDAINMTQAYGGFIGKGAPIIADASLLPYPKEELQQAMLVYEQHLCEVANKFLAAGERERLPQIDEILRDLRAIRGYLLAFTTIAPEDVDEVSYFNSYAKLDNVPQNEVNRCMGLSTHYMSKGMEDAHPGWAKMAEEVGTNALRKYLNNS